MISRWGIPETLVSDNGPQFTCDEFDVFVKTYGIKHVSSSPHFHQSNGEAERAVQIAKNIIRQKDPFLALLSYRDTPTSSLGYSPKELMLSRKVRTTVPGLPSMLQPKWPNGSQIQHNDSRTKSDQAYHFNKTQGATDLPVLHLGNNVRMKLDNDKQWSPAGTVVKESVYPR
ncbi:uncharacterized protein K02A2.6-like [Liolophura sinensis]|uniref:uncharacterized protein K02A2.6-like n=1 Tax=Liolophura sinensis TaxID=3198878 RepID=UPI0031584676